MSLWGECIQRRCADGSHQNCVQMSPYSSTTEWTQVTKPSTAQTYLQLHPWHSRQLLLRLSVHVHAWSFWMKRSRCSQIYQVLVYQGASRSLSAWGCRVEWTQSQGCAVLMPGHAHSKAVCLVPGPCFPTEVSWAEWPQGVIWSSAIHWMWMLHLRLVRHPSLRNLHGIMLQVVCGWDKAEWYVVGHAAFVKRLGDAEGMWRGAWFDTIPGIVNLLEDPRLLSLSA